MTSGSLTGAALAPAGDEVIIAETLARLGWYVDSRDWRRDWAALPGLFGATVAADYTSLFGGDPAEVGADDLLDQWRALLSSLDSTQHVITSVLARLDGDRTVATANLMAMHSRRAVMGDERFTVGGTYDVGLERTAGGWQITAPGR
jgi:hypothetical protein